MLELLFDCANLGLRVWFDGEAVVEDFDVAGEVDGAVYRNGDFAGGDTMRPFAQLNHGARYAFLGAGPLHAVRAVPAAEAPQRDDGGAGAGDARSGGGGEGAAGATADAAVAAVTDAGRGSSSSSSCSSDDDE